MKRSSNTHSRWVWREVIWPRPFDPELALEFLDRLGTDSNTGRIVFEARGSAGTVHHLVAAHPHHLHALSDLVRNLLPETRLIPAPAQSRPPIKASGRLSASRNSLALNVDRVTAVSRAVFAGLAAAGEGEQAVLQVILGAPLSPSFVPRDAPDPRASWLDLIRNTVPAASAETRASMKTRVSLHGFKTSIRIGASAATPATAQKLSQAVVGGLRVAEAAGVRLRITPEHPAKLNTARYPWRSPLQLCARELVALIGWPLNKDPQAHLPGLPGPHPRQLPAPEGMKNSVHPFAVTTAPGTVKSVGISPKDSLQHTVLLGPTGAGKSNTMLTLAMDAISSGRSVLVIDPKTDLVNDILARVPENRKQDVIVIDPTDSRPVGLNPLAGAGRNPELVADSILAVFHELWSDSWGPRTQDILTAALITLAHYPGATLTMLPALLTEQKFRRKVTVGLTDRIGLGSFWASYEAMSMEQRAQVIAPVMNKLRQFLLRPALRAVIGQSDPGFHLQDLFTKRRIVLVSLNKGLIGADAARLLGSLVVAQLWPLTLARAAVPPERRHVVSIFIDELQDYLALPSDTADALSQARGLGVALTLAHQYRAQLPAALRAAVDSNARNKIIFGLNAGDAADMAKMAPGLDSQDFMLLPRFQIYANLMHDGRSTGWFSAATLPALPATGDPVELRSLSAEHYGHDAADVERQVLAAVGLEPTGAAKEDDDEPIGRRPTQSRRPQ